MADVELGSEIKLEETTPVVEEEAEAEAEAEPEQQEETPQETTNGVKT